MEGEKAGVGNKPGSVNDNHSSGTAVTDCLLQPTRESARNRRCGQAAYSPIWSCSRRGLPCRELLPVARCALTAPFHPYRQKSEDTTGGIFSVALSMDSRPPGVTWRPVRRSPDFPLQALGVQRLSGQLLLSRARSLLHISGSCWANVTFRSGFFQFEQSLIKSIALFTGRPGDSLGDLFVGQLAG